MAGGGGKRKKKRLGQQKKDFVKKINLTICVSKRSIQEYWTKEIFIPQMAAGNDGGGKAPQLGGLSRYVRQWNVLRSHPLITPCNNGLCHLS